MAIKILATADIHIGRKSAGISTNSELISTRSTWNLIVDLAIREGVDVLALAGDIVDHDNRFFEAIGPLKSGFEKLAREGIEVFITAGNHDYDVLPHLIKTNTLPNVHLLGANGYWTQEMFEKNGEKVRFVGWSFSRQYETMDPLRGWDLKIPEDGIPVVGLVHGDVDTPQSRYAPISSNELASKPVDLWILGHIHKPQMIQDRHPKVFYPGSPHALSAKETGEHGPALIKIASKQSSEIRWMPLSPVRYEKVEIDVSGTGDADSVRTRIYNTVDENTNDISGSLKWAGFLIYDLAISGVYPNLDELDECLLQIRDTEDLSGSGHTQIQVRNISVHARPEIADMEALARQASPAGILASAILALRCGGTTPFLDAVIPKWYQQHKSLIDSKTYRSIKPDLNAENPESTAKQYIEQECNRLLNELMNQ